jgi:hypothetical protein
MCTQLGKSGPSGPRKRFEIRRALAPVIVLPRQIAFFRSLLGKTSCLAKIKNLIPEQRREIAVAEIALASEAGHLCFHFFTRSLRSPTARTSH